MEPMDDPLLREMRVERIRLDDGRTLLLYSWPLPADSSAASPARNDTPLDPWSPETGPADV